MGARPGPGGLSPLLHRLVSLEFPSWERPSAALEMLVLRDT